MPSMANEHEHADFLRDVFRVGITEAVVGKGTAVKYSIQL
jgi:hypothetical protein